MVIRPSSRARLNPVSTAGSSPAARTSARLATGSSTGSSANSYKQDGGWNCEAPPSKRSSFNTTICVLEGLLEYEKAKGATSAVKDARLRGQEYLLERKLFKSLSTGEVIDRDRKSDCDWREFSFPTRWHYDVLWGLDYLRKAGASRDERMAGAIDLVAGKQGQDGRWRLDRVHAGKVHFDMEGGPGTPSRWNTLRATRVLGWYAAGTGG